MLDAYCKTHNGTLSPLTQGNFASSFLHLLLLLRRRHLEILSSVPRHSVTTVPQRVLAKMNALQKRAEEERCVVHGNPEGSNLMWEDVTVTTRVCSPISVEKVKQKAGNGSASDRAAWAFVTGAATT